MTTDKTTRLADARQVARELLDELETGSAPVEKSLLRAQRLARLLRDPDAQQWLQYELVGYPKKLDTSTIGGCAKYVGQMKRFYADGTMFTLSMPAIEASVRAEEQMVAKMEAGSGALTQPIENYLVAGATQKVMEAADATRQRQKQVFVNMAESLSAMKAILHTYATDCYLALEFGDVAEDLFEAARGAVDAFVRANCPRAAEQLVSIAERMKEGQRESWAEALASCRRLLASVADSVFPAADEPYVDASGKKRKVGQEQFVNRIMAFIERRLASAGSLAILTAELEHLASRLDAVHEKACKGVHAEVSEDEARLAVVHTYLIVAEIARLSRAPGPAT